MRNSRPGGPPQVRLQDTRGSPAGRRAISLKSFGGRWETSRESVHSGPGRNQSAPKLMFGDLFFMRKCVDFQGFSLKFYYQHFLWCLSFNLIPDLAARLCPLLCRAVSHATLPRKCVYFGPRCQNKCHAPPRVVIYDHESFMIQPRTKKNPHFSGQCGKGNQL